VIDWNAAPLNAPKASKKPNQIRGIVTDLINDGHGEMRSPFADKPPMKCISDDDVRKAFYRRDADRQRSYEARYKAATRAMKVAATSGAVGMLDGWLWLT
jgi:hypothetical protein